MGNVETTFAGEIVVVTGAGSGIGRATSQGFSREGATVVGVGRRASTLARTAELCGGSMTFVCADLSRPGECCRAIDEVIATHGRIDVLVNNAGTAATGGFLETPFEDWLDVIALNVLGVAACTRAVLPQMILQEKGRIITLTSRLAGSASPGNSAYSASRAAASALTRCLAAEVSLAHPNILINDLIPGLTRTGMSAEGQHPDEVWPYLRSIALLPAGGPSGQVFFKGQRHVLFAAD